MLPRKTSWYRNPPRERSNGQRKDYKHGLALRNADNTAALFHVCSIIAMGEENTLRVGGGAGSVGDVCIVIGPMVAIAFPIPEFSLRISLPSCGARLCPFRHPAILLYQHNYLANRLALLDYPADFGKLVFRCHNIHRIRMVYAERRSTSDSIYRKGAHSLLLHRGYPVLTSPKDCGLRKQRHPFSLLETERHKAGGQYAAFISSLFVCSFSQTPSTFSRR